MTTSKSVSHIRSTDDMTNNIDDEIELYKKIKKVYRELRTFDLMNAKRHFSTDVQICKNV